MSTHHVAIRIAGPTPAVATSSSFCSSIATIVRHRSSNGVFFIPWELASVAFFSSKVLWVLLLLSSIQGFSHIYAFSQPVEHISPNVLLPQLLLLFRKINIGAPPVHVRLWLVRTCSTSLRVHTCTLRPHSYQVHTCLLWGYNLLPTRASFLLVLADTKP